MPNTRIIYRNLYENQMPLTSNKHAVCTQVAARSLELLTRDGLYARLHPFTHMCKNRYGERRGFRKTNRHHGEDPLLEALNIEGEDSSWGMSEYGIEKPKRYSLSLPQ